MRVSVMIVALIGLALPAHAELRKQIGPGERFSYINNILTVEVAHTSNVVARVYEVLVPGKPDEAMEILQVVADYRPPTMIKASLLQSWALGSRLRRIDEVVIDDATIVIRGPNDRGLTLSCTMVLQFVDGVLSKELDDRGCK